MTVFRKDYNTSYSPSDKLEETIEATFTAGSVTLTMLTNTTKIKRALFVSGIVAKGATPIITSAAISTVTTTNDTVTVKGVTHNNTASTASFWITIVGLPS
jgi:hypothetical protein